MKFKKTGVYVALASLLRFMKLMVDSLYMNVTGKNTRQATDKLAKAFGDDMLALAGATLTVKGQLPPIIPGRSYIIISSHASHFDIPAVYAGIPLSIRMIAKKELYDVPLFGIALKNHEFIKLDRQNRTHAMKALAEAKALMETGIVIWAAAEGTRSRTGELLPFKKGIFMLAIDAQAIVIPLVIQGTHGILPSKTWRFSADQDVTLTIGTPIDTMNMTANDRDKLMTDVRSQMEAVFAKKDNV
ncbi:MAG: lysophospholipid acyltransferase family protein [Gammaproteobacteria bacterium]